MNEEKDQKPEGSEQDFSEFAKHSRPQPGPGDLDGRGSGDWFFRGCGIVVGVAALIFFLILGTCFLG
jgi:hypothetical protein